MLLPVSKTSELIDQVQQTADMLGDDIGQTMTEYLPSMIVSLATDANHVVVEVPADCEHWNDDVSDAVTQGLKAARTADGAGIGCKIVRT